MASAAEQTGALRALMTALAPSALALPDAIVKKIPPRPSGYGRTRELFPRYTGLMFDAVTPAVVAAEHVVGSILTADRAARLVEQKALDASLPGLDDVIDALYAASFSAPVRNAYEAEVKRAVERVVVDELMDLAGSAPMSQVRAIATLQLQRRATELGRATPGTGGAGQGGGMAAAAHAALLSSDITRFLTRPATAVAIRMPGPDIPPGAPIGDPGMEWLRRVEPACSMYDGGWW